MVNILATKHFVADISSIKPINYFWNRNTDSVSKEQKKSWQVILRQSFSENSKNIRVFWQYSETKFNAQILSFFCSIFSRIWTEYEIYSANLLVSPNMEKWGLEKTPYLDTFQAVLYLLVGKFSYQI